MRIISVERTRPLGFVHPELTPMEQVNYLMNLCLEWTPKENDRGTARPGLQRVSIRLLDAKNG